MEGLRLPNFYTPFFFIPQLTNRQPITTIMMSRQAISRSNRILTHHQSMIWISFSRRKRWCSRKVTKLRTYRRVCEYIRGIDFWYILVEVANTVEDAHCKRFTRPPWHSMHYIDNGCRHGWSWRPWYLPWNCQYRPCLEGVIFLWTDSCVGMKHQLEVLTYATTHNIAFSCPYNLYGPVSICDNARSKPPCSLLSAAAVFLNISTCCNL